MMGFLPTEHDVVIPRPAHAAWFTNSGLQFHVGGAIPFSIGGQTHNDDHADGRGHAGARGLVTGCELLPVAQTRASDGPQNGRA
jgi:hypothetical protein